MPQTGSDVLAAARALRGLILANREETERQRQLAQPIVDALIDSRLGRMALPESLDGLELPPTDALAVFETLAAAEASVAWIVWNSSLPCWLGRFLADEARREVLGDRRALYASSTRPTGKAVRANGGYRVSGRWSLVSGCMHATWIPVMCLVEKDGAVEMLAPKVPHMRMFYLPRHAFEIVDTWHVGGLRGTGSHDAVLNDMTVPVARSFAVGDPSRVDSALGRMPITAVMSAGCASICLGIASASLEALLKLAIDKPNVDGGPGLRDRAPVQALVAGIETNLEAARARLRSTCDRLWRLAEASAERKHEAIAAVLGAAITTAQTCRAAVREIHAVAGTSALYTASPIERAFRDIHAVGQHIVLQPFWLEQAGRVRLGLEPTHPLFLL